MVDLDKQKRLLDDKLQELTARAQTIDDDLSEPADDDWSENAVEAADDEVLEEVGEVTLEEIQLINLALARIEKGTYGTCAGCGDPIPEGRLEALPHATRCIKCA